MTEAGCALAWQASVVPRRIEAESYAMPIEDDENIEDDEEAQYPPTPPNSDDDLPSDSVESNQEPPPESGETGRLSALLFSEIAEEEEPPVPEKIGMYRVLNKIGEGGMGVVYHAEREEGFKQSVAIKLIRLGMDSREVIHRFQLELKALALMSHPGIARALDAGTLPDGRPYFVMEYVPGVPITEYCDNERLHTGERLALFVKVCDAIRHAHQKGIIHRDIKPANVLIMLEDGKPVPKVIDFGVAKALDQRLSEKTMFTRRGAIVGTPIYMSPEQAEGSALDVDTRSDIYSLGVLLYELLVGVTPIDPKIVRAAGFKRMLEVLRETDIPLPSRRVTTLSDAVVLKRRGLKRSAPLVRELRGDLDWVCLKSLEKNRARRYASVSEFAEDLRRYLRFEPTNARPPAFTSHVGRILRRHRRATIAVAIFLTTILVVAIGTAWITRNLRFQEALDACRQSLSIGQDAIADLGRIERRHIEATQELHALGKMYAKPFWERREELDLHRELRELAEQESSISSEAALHLQRAADRSPDGASEKRQALELLERLYWQRFERARDEGGTVIDAPFLASLVKGVGLGTYSDRLDGGEVRFSGIDAGAELWCFRFESFDARLVPLAYRPEKGLLAKPWLEIAKIREEARARAPFEPGDRILAIGPRTVSSRETLVQLVRGVARGTALNITVERDGEKRSVRWIPWPTIPASDGDDGNDAVDAAKEDRPPPLRSIADDLGIELATAPLEFHPEHRIQVTGPEYSARLPAGSYLFVFRKPTFLDARYPVSFPRPEDEVTKVHLLPGDSRPPGFVYIPASVITHGQDRDVDQALPLGRSFVDDFFISRLEVTFGEFLEFVNDPKISARIDPEDGRALPDPDLWPAEAHGLVKPTTRLLFIPALSKSKKSFLLTLEDGKWKNKRIVDLKEPVFGISIAIAWEYTHWRTQRETGASNNWVYRLPTDLEWEKAAGGGLGRAHVWGNDPVFSFCNAGIGVNGNATTRLSGSFPADRSVYGVQDMAGSMMEPTLDQTEAHNFVSTRGGAWNEYTPYYFRIANRNGFKASQAWKHMGIRLVAQPVR